MSRHRLRVSGEKVFWEVVRVVIRETIRAARVVREIYTVKPESEEERLQREKRQWYARQRFLRESQERERQSRKRAQEGDWIDWMNENVHPNTPPWMQATNRWFYEWLLMFGVAFIGGVALIILFIIAVNMG